MQQLIDAIQCRGARCGVIGLGYVGLPLALEFARAGFRTTGIDVDSEKVAVLPLRNGYLGHVDCAVILTDHREFDYEAVVASVPVVVDTRNALRGIDGGNIIRL